MKPLPAKIEWRNNTYKRIKRDDNVYLYFRRLGKGRRQFIVFVADLLPERTIKGRKYSEKEVIPKNIRGMKRVWSFRSFEKASKKFHSLLIEEFRNPLREL